MGIPQPAMLEEPPIPVGLQLELQAQQKLQQQQQQQQQHASIALVLPNSKSDSDENQRKASDIKPTEDVTTISQQEELSVKGIFHPFHY